MGTGNQQARSWQEMRQWQMEMLESKKGQKLETWNDRVAEIDPRNEQGVTGYSQMLLVHECFGYPDFFTKTAQELVDTQFADRQQLREIYDTLMSRLSDIGDVVVQARKTFTGLQAQRRTFAVLAPVTKNRLDLGLRWEQAPTSSRLLPPGSRLGSSVTTRVGRHIADDLDDELMDWLGQAYRSNL
ncbi:DUF5655 domain-containing protein [Glutamicibacter sp. JC586]|uniref:DUF5655 domain-containing protein n=1 Tax=Glutamicibacter sp. JC586 TaxID=2590552 RepID=UPI001357702B|nr:DUF5655 domain-containing protein [Glutamicibacter sp. JC586]